MGQRQQRTLVRDRQRCIRVDHRLPFGSIQGTSFSCEKVPLHRQFPNLAMQDIRIGRGIRFFRLTTTLEYRRPVFR